MVNENRAPAPGVVEAQIAFVLEQLDRGEDIRGEAAKYLAGWLKLALAALQATSQEPKRPAMHRIRLTTEGWYNTEVRVEDIELLRAKAPDLFLEKRLDEIMGRHVAYVTAQKAKGEPQEPKLKVYVAGIEDIVSGGEAGAAPREANQGMLEVVDFLEFVANTFEGKSLGNRARNVLAALSRPNGEAGAAPRDGEKEKE